MINLKDRIFFWIAPLILKPLVSSITVVNSHYLKIAYLFSTRSWRSSSYHPTAPPLEWPCTARTYTAKFKLF